jgi:hypothetical protein
MDKTFSNRTNVENCTLDLLKFVNDYGYDNVVMIDFTCDCAANNIGPKAVMKEFIANLRYRVNKGEVGR